jgi:hypothetical protein
MKKAIGEAMKKLENPKQQFERCTEF